MNAVLFAVTIMLVLSLARMHVVLALLIGALVGGLISDLGLVGTLESLTEGLKGGAGIALSYVLLGAFAEAISHSGLPKHLAQKVITSLDGTQNNREKTITILRWGILLALLVMAIFSQNLIPIHIAFIPILVPPLLALSSTLKIDRRAMACVMTFGLVTTYMFLPVGFGSVFLNDILLFNISESGLPTDNLNVMTAMSIPALGMVVGLLIALLISYRKPREYKIIEVEKREETSLETETELKPLTVIVAIVAICVAFAVQLLSDSMLLGALLGFFVFILGGVVRWSEMDFIFNRGVAMMGGIGFIMISAQGFAQVMKDTGHIENLVDVATKAFGSNQIISALVMLIVGLVITMGIGSSFSTLPIIAAIYVPLCISLGFSPLATVAIIGTAGALGDAGSPASDSTLGPTAGLALDRQHDHIKDTVIPTFIHFNIPLILAGLVAALVL